MVEPICLSSDQDRRAQLRQRLLDSLQNQGFEVQNGRLQLSADTKLALRQAHAGAVAHNIARAKSGLKSQEGRLLKFIAKGTDVVPTAIRPRLVEVQPDSREELLFRYARLHWSIPVSAGYGRRLRFLLIDESNDKLIGVIGLSDPVFALGARDSWIGWTREARRSRLANVMDAFVLGAVPPYSSLLCGKLVALAAASLEVQEAFSRRYGTKPTLIAGKQVGPLAMLTTTSALGRSSIYNRLSYSGEKVFQPVGFTRGSGDFQFFNGFYKDLRTFVLDTSSPTAKHEKWGNGFRNRREVVLKALSELGLSRNLIYHGVSREVFLIPTAHNSAEYLRGEADMLDQYHRPLNEISDYFLDRWLLPRATRDSQFREFDPETWRFWPSP